MAAPDFRYSTTATIEWSVNLGFSLCQIFFCQDEQYRYTLWSKGLSRSQKSEWMSTFDNVRFKLFWFLNFFYFEIILPNPCKNCIKSIVGFGIGLIIYFLNIPGTFSNKWLKTIGKNIQYWQIDHLPKIPQIFADFGGDIKSLVRMFLFVAVKCLIFITYNSRCWGY